MRNLTINGNLPGPDFEISGLNAGQPASMQFVGPAAIQVTLPTSSQGSIAGAITFVNAPHTITAAFFESLIFVAGGAFTAGAGFTGNPFGTTGTTNSTVFQSGSVYTQLAGASPFGNTASAVARFDQGSRFIAKSSPLALNNRTFGTLELATNFTASGTGILNVLNELEVTSGTANLSLSTINISGNLVINGETVNFNGGAASVVRFNGTTTQTITGSGGNNPSFDGNLEVSNPTGLTLLRPTRANGGLALLNGVIRTAPTTSLTLGPAAVLSGGSAVSFVEGPLSRETTATGQLSFPIGKGTNYRQLRLNITTAPFGTTTYTAEQNEGAPTDQTLLGNIRSISRIRYFTVTPNPVPALDTFAGTIELSFGTNDGVLNPAASSFVVAKSNGSGWENIGHSSNTNTTLVSAPFSSFSSFVLASTDPAVNPLPVTLSRFTAEQVANGVQLRWGTATEHNNRHFEVQRSDDSRNFTTIATVQGQGYSTTAHTYTVVDEQDFLGIRYYRLRQIDFDSIVTFSPVLAVTTGQQKIILYPNPTYTELHIMGLKYEDNYRVLNLLGKTVLEGKAKDCNATLNVSQLPVGIYQLEVRSVTGCTTHKFLKQE